MTGPSSPSSAPSDDPDGVRTYRGRTIEELIPRIRAELGPDAIILREREGLMGGIGGFFLPNLLGSLKQITGSFSGGFLTFGLVGCFGCAAALTYASRSWQGVFVGRGASPRALAAPSFSTNARAIAARRATRRRSTSRPSRRLR